jgi:hypothetical protein
MVDVSSYLCRWTWGRCFVELAVEDAVVVVMFPTGSEIGAATTAKYQDVKPEANTRDLNGRISVEK